MNTGPRRTLLIIRQFFFTGLETRSQMFIQLKGVPGREDHRDIKLRRDPVHELEFLGVNNEHFGESRELGCSSASSVY
jgi:hypothetical protein